MIWGIGDGVSQNREYVSFIAASGSGLNLQMFCFLPRSPPYLRTTLCQGGAIDVPLLLIILQPYSSEANAKFRQMPLICFACVGSKYHSSDSRLTSTPRGHPRVSRVWIFTKVRSLGVRAIRASHSHATRHDAALAVA